MSKTQSVVDPSALQRVEAVYRSRILADPCDTLARARLAWCLFLQSLHRAGQESVLEALRELEATPESLVVASTPTEAQHLLAECLRQTETVLHLAAPGEERSEMERLLGLARLSVGQPALDEAEGRAQAILDRLLQDLHEPSRLLTEAEEGLAGEA